MLMAVAISLILLLTSLRNFIGGEVMRSRTVFVPMFWVLLAWLLFQAFVLLRLHLLNRARVVLAPWHWIANASVDLVTPLLLLTILVYRSPDGPLAALSAPIVLLPSLVIVASVLRLQPWITLASGVISGLWHLSMVVMVARAAAAPASAYPQFFTYGIAMFLTGLCGALVAREVRGFVRSAVAEAQEREAAKRELARVEHDLAVARDIQVGLLPAAAPSLPGFDIAGMNRPADETGGDYFDWQPLPNGRLACVLADVTGHGIGPALVMAVCRAYARATAPLATDAGSMLTRLNALLHTDLQSGRFVTLAAALLSPDGSVDLLSAGHGPTLLFTAATGEVRQFGGDGLPLGITADEQYSSSHRLKLESGDVLLMVTDGFFEWQQPSGEQFGIERLQQALIQHARSESKTMISDIDEMVREFCAGSVQPDDMTAVVIRRL